MENFPISIQKLANSKEETCQFQYAQLSAGRNLKHALSIVAQGLERAQLARNEINFKLWQLLKVNLMFMQPTFDLSFLENLDGCLTGIGGGSESRDLQLFISVLELVYLLKHQKFDFTLKFYPPNVTFDVDFAFAGLLKSLYSLWSMICHGRYPKPDEFLVDSIPACCTIKLSLETIVVIDFSSLVHLPRFIRSLSLLSAMNREFATSCSELPDELFMKKVFCLVQKMGTFESVDMEAFVSTLTMEEYRKHKEFIFCLHALNTQISGKLDTARLMFQNICKTSKNSAIEAFATFHLALFDPVLTREQTVSGIVCSKTCDNLRMALVNLSESQYYKTKTSLFDALKSAKDESVHFDSNQLKLLTILLLAHVYRVTNNEQTGKMVDSAKRYAELIETHKFDEIIMEMSSKSS